jgi:hypothetical protein
MRYENLEEEYRDVLAIIGINSSEAPLKQMKRGHRPKQDYRTFYTRETADLVSRWHEKEIAFFGYEF